MEVFIFLSRVFQKLWPLLLLLIDICIWNTGVWSFHMMKYLQHKMATVGCPPLKNNVLIKSIIVYALWYVICNDIQWYICKYMQIYNDIFENICKYTMIYLQHKMATVGGLPRLPPLSNSLLPHTLFRTQVRFRSNSHFYSAHK